MIRDIHISGEEYEKFAQGVDSFTPFARGVFDRLNGQQLRVFVALCNMGGEAHATDTAWQARLEERRTSTALTRLRRQGLVKLENHMHSVVDKRLVVWYLCRRHGLPPAFRKERTLVERFKDISWDIEGERERSKERLEELIAECSI